MAPEGTGGVLGNVQFASQIYVLNRPCTLNRRYNFLSSGDGWSVGQALYPFLEGGKVSYGSLYPGRLTSPVPSGYHGCDLLTCAALLGKSDLPRSLRLEWCGFFVKRPH